MPIEAIAGDKIKIYEYAENEIVIKKNDIYLSISTYSDKNTINAINKELNI
jgi:hypothetical protein